MFNLTAAIKLKIGKYNQEYLEQATNKCLEARSMVQKATESQNPGLMFKAVEIYIEAIKIYPRLIEPYLSIAYICWKFKDYNNAILLLNQATEIDPLNQNTRDLLYKINRDKNNSNFSKLKEKYQKNETGLKTRKKAKPHGGLLSQIFDLFSFGSQKIVGQEILSAKKKLDDFAESLAEFSKMMSYEQVKIKVDKNTLNRMADAMIEKESRPHQSIKPSPERLEMNTEVSHEKLDNLPVDSKETLQEKKYNLDKEQVIMKVNRLTFSKITKK